ncbi:glycosyltransferase family protein [Paraburkholderia ferrariae]|uniref:glycosyltransferase n=1 Tax=Paraburkholderia ferrariae TaxID=386056 RepID=UPI00048609F9|nr:glycosyltransferase [Paraburkholderia ferrariae]
MKVTTDLQGPNGRLVLITCFNADAPTSGYATRVLQMVESYAARGFTVCVLRFVPIAHRARSWREILLKRGASRVFEWIAPPVSRYELGRRLAVWWGRPLAFALRLRLRPAVVQAEGHEAAAVTLLRTAHALQVADLHGAVPEETEYRRREQGLAAAQATRWFHRQEARALGVCDAYLVVSDDMISHLRSKLGSLAFHHKAFVLDVKSSPSFTHAAVRVNRQDYGIADDETVIVYSGGVQAYQRIPAIASFVATLAKHVKQVRFVVFTADPGAARQQLGALASAAGTIIASVPPAELHAHLRIADFGIIFRDDHVINRVASPTKIWEYLLSGLHVICNRAAGNAAESAGALDAAIVVDPHPAPADWPHIARAVEAVMRERRSGPDTVATAARRYLQQEGGWDSRFDAWLTHVHRALADRHGASPETSS